MTTELTQVNHQLVKFGQKRLALILEGKYDWHNVNKYGGDRKKSEPVPVISKDSEEYTLAKNNLAVMVNRIATPATVRQIGNAMLRLKAHYQTKVDDKLESVKADDYIRLLGLEGFSEDTLQAGVDKWIAGEKKFIPETSNTVYFPKTSELITVCKTVDMFRRFQIKKIQTLIDLAE